MKSFRGFVIKEFLHIFRDKRTMLLLFGLPVMQILLFGFVITNEIRNVNIAVYDQSKDPVTRLITEKLISSGYFILYKHISSQEEMGRCFRQGKVREVIIFEPGFARRLEKEGTAHIQIVADASDANTASIAVNYTSGIIRNAMKDINPLNRHTPPLISTEVRMLYNTGLLGAYMFVPGIMAMILILISALMTSISITREKELGTMEVLLVSPLKPAQVIIGKIIPYLMFSFIDAVVIIVLGYLTFDVPVKGSIVLLLSECLLFIFMSLSLGIMISSLTNSQQVAMMLSAFSLLLPTLLLSGFIFPIENMPKILQYLSLITPPRWFIIIIKNIMLKGTGFEYIWKETLIIASMTFLFVMISIRKFKTRLE